MKNKKAEVTIRRRTSNITGDSIVITVEDDASGIVVAEVELGLEEFAACITGHAFVRGKFLAAVSKEDARNLGKKKKVIREYCKKVHCKITQRKLVIENYEEKYGNDDNYQLDHDGCSSKQQGEFHEYVVVQYVGGE